jgi:hypothetical protein
MLSLCIFTLSSNINKHLFFKRFGLLFTYIFLCLLTSSGTLFYTYSLVTQLLINWGIIRLVLDQKVLRIKSSKCFITCYFTLFIIITSLFSKKFSLKLLYCSSTILGPVLIRCTLIHYD